MSARTSRKQEDLSELLAQLRADGVPEPEQQIRPLPPRRWRIDAGYRAQMIAIEVEGAIWVQGRHTRGQGYEDDCRKYNALALAGWLLIRVTYGMIKSGEAVEYIKAAIVARTPMPVLTTVTPLRRARRTTRRKAATA